jgi:hypothetical protein
LDKPGTITGVVSAGGKPLAGADVAYSAWGDAGPAWNARTDAQGRYTIGRLGPYAWPLLFGAPGYPRQWSGHVPDRFAAQTVPVVEGGTSTYDFTPAAASSTLKGAVSVPGAPAATWRLTVRNAVTGDQLATFDSSAAGAGGAYSVALAGDQRVKIGWSYQRGDTGVRGWYGGAADLSTAAGVDIPATGSRELDLLLD